MKRLKQILDFVKLAAALGMMCCIAYLFTFYLDGDIGVVVWAFLLIAPLLSLLLAWNGKRKLTVLLSAPGYIAKGKTFRVKMKIQNAGRLPVPFVQCRLDQSAGLRSKDTRPIQTAMTGMQHLEAEEEVVAVHAGCSIISTADFSVSDYLGLFRFALPVTMPPVRIGVIPEVASISGAGVMLHAVSDVVLTQDEDEEESAASFSSVASPGYIHRDYVPGDNLRRINWKLSAKRNRLMVRMDEAAATVRPTVILDLQPETEEEALTIRDTMMEGALGFLMLLVRQGIVCTIRYASGGEWNCLSLETEDAVRSAAVEISTADFYCGEHRLDTMALKEKTGAYMIYTSRPDAVLQKKLAAYRSNGYVCMVIPESVPEEGLQADAIWKLSKEFDMTAVQK